MVVNLQFLGGRGSSRGLGGSSGRPEKKHTRQTRRKERHLMGGRGASSGISDSGKRYGTEYKTIAQFGNVKVVRANDGGAKAPMETMTPGRVYATVDKFNDIKYITFHDAEGERVKQIDVKGKKHNGALPHTHNGYEHDEYGTYPGLSGKDEKLVNNVLQQWERKRKKLNL